MVYQKIAKPFKDLYYPMQGIHNPLFGLPRIEPRRVINTFMISTLCGFKMKVHVFKQFDLELCYKGHISSQKLLLTKENLRQSVCKI